MRLSACGNDCDTCRYRESHGCTGCQETGGAPFWGSCDRYACAGERQLYHCGFCDAFPCEKLNLNDEGEDFQGKYRLRERMAEHCRVQSRCGLCCGDCAWRLDGRCGGCLETQGHPFHGPCPIAHCCQDRGYAHCGQCGNLPCDALYAYSCLDQEHGDRPAGARINVLRRWAGQPCRVLPTRGDPAVGVQKRRKE